MNALSVKLSKNSADMHELAIASAAKEVDEILVHSYP